MARSLAVGDTVYIVGRYGYTNDHMVYVIQAKIYTIKNNRYHAYETLNDVFEWSFNESDYLKAVFKDRESAWRAAHELQKVKQ